MGSRIDDGRRANLCESIALGAIGVGDPSSDSCQGVRRVEIASLQSDDLLEIGGREDIRACPVELRDAVLRAFVDRRRQVKLDAVGVIAGAECSCLTSATSR